MNLRTRLALIQVRDEYYKNYLKDQINSGQLNDKQIQYLIKNLNDNDYILQNIIPVAEAMKKKISIQTIEKTASLLDDACGQSIFANDLDKGKLYNKVPDDLMHLVNLNETFNLSLSQEFKREKEITRYEKDLKSIIELLYECRRLRTIDVFKENEFWDLTISNNHIDQIKCDQIRNYNSEIRKYIESNHIDSMFTPNINSLLDLGLNMAHLSRFKCSDILTLQEQLNTFEKKLLEDNNLQKIKIKFLDSQYDLCIEKITNIRLVNDLDVGAREEYFVDTMVFFENKNNSDDFALSDSSLRSQCNKFMKLLIDSSLKSIQEIFKIPTEEYENILQAEWEKKSLGPINILRIMQDLKDNVQSGQGETSLSLISGEDTIEMNAYVCEKDHKSYSIDSDILLNGENLLEKFNSVEAVIQYLKENIDVNKLQFLDDAIFQKETIENNTSLELDEDEEDYELG